MVLGRKFGSLAREGSTRRFSGSRSMFRNILTFRFSVCYRLGNCRGDGNFGRRERSVLKWQFVRWWMQEACRGFSDRWRVFGKAGWVENMFLEVKRGNSYLLGLSKGCFCVAGMSGSFRGVRGILFCPLIAVVAFSAIANHCAIPWALCWPRTGCVGALAEPVIRAVGAGSRREGFWRFLVVSEGRLGKV